MNASHQSDAAGPRESPYPGWDRARLGYRRAGGDGCACVDGVRKVGLVDNSALAEMEYDAWDPLASGCGSGCGSGGCGVHR